MKFCEFINKLYPHYACNNQGRFVLQIFSALCGEKNPVATSGKDEHVTENGSDVTLAGSSLLARGLRGLDDSARTALFGGKGYSGLSAPIKEYILGHNNRGTFVAYSEAVVSTDGFNKLCADLAIGGKDEKSEKADKPEKKERKFVFMAIFEQFLEFAKSGADEAADVLNAKIEEAKGAMGSQGKFSVNNFGNIENQKFVTIDTVNGNITL